MCLDIRGSVSWSVCAYLTRTGIGSACALELVYVYVAIVVRLFVCGQVWFSCVYILMYVIKVSSRHMWLTVWRCNDINMYVFTELLYLTLHISVFYTVHFGTYMYTISPDNHYIQILITMCYNVAIRSLLSLL